MCKLLYECVNQRKGKNPLWLIPLLGMLSGKAGMVTEPLVVLAANHFCCLLSKETKGNGEVLKGTVSVG